MRITVINPYKNDVTTIINYYKKYCVPKLKFINFIKLCTWERPHFPHIMLLGHLTMTSKSFDNVETWDMLQKANSYMPTYVNSPTYQPRELIQLLAFFFSLLIIKFFLFYINAKFYCRSWNCQQLLWKSANDIILD